VSALQWWRHDRGVAEDIALAFADTANGLPWWAWRRRRRYMSAAHLIADFVREGDRRMRR
jgi:hypothetical protein